jgi:type I restriction enzyme S subunit
MTSDAVAFPLRTLRDAGVRLYDCEHKTPPAAPGGYPYIAIPDIRDGRIDLSNVRRISEDHFLEWTRKTTPRSGDIVLTRRGRVGDTAAIPEGLKCAIGQNLVILRSESEELQQSYLRWALRGPLYERQVDKFLNVGAVFSSLNCRHIPLFEIPIPPVQEQRRIAGVLRSLDRKIEHNRGLRLALDGAVSRIAAEYISVAHDEQALDEVARFVNGKAFTKHASGLGRPILRIKELNSGLSEATPYAEIDADDDNLARHHDLLFSWSGTLDVYRWDGPESLINQHIFKVVPNNGYPLWLVEYWARQHLEPFRVIAKDKAVTMGHIRREDLSSAQVSVPDADALGQARELVDPMDRMRGAIAVENRHLAAIRDTLLPKLVSGEIRVPDTYDPDDVLGTVAEAAGVAVP